MSFRISESRLERVAKCLLAAAVFRVLAPEGGAEAQEATSLVAVEPTATMESIGILASYLGDDDQDAFARLLFRTSGAPAFETGHVLVRLPGRRWAGSVLFLVPGTAYDIKVVVDDPDNPGPETLETTVHTRADAPPDPPPPGVTFWVDAAVGSDSNPGTPELPFRTIQAGANAARAGDSVKVRPGVYTEQVAPPRGGSPDEPIWFQAAGPGVILDGSDPALTTGAAWIRASSKLYWTPFAGDTRYVAIGDERLYDYQSLADLQAENGNIGLPGAIRGGFFVDRDRGRLYLITPDHTSPAGHQIHASIRPNAFRLDGISDTVVEGFTLRYFWSNAVVLRETARSWIRWNTIHHCAGAVQVYNPGASQNVIERNAFRDTSVFEWPWDSVKGHTAEYSAISINHGFGNVVRWNSLEGSFNGIYSGIWEVSGEEIARDTDIYENRLNFHGDDSLELEWDQRNVRAWENRIVNPRNAISISPIQVGPVFLVRNLVQGYAWNALKVNNGTPGYVFAYHNTARPASGALFPDAQAFTPPLPFGNLVTRNNLWEANRYVIEFMPTSTLGGVSLDFDDLFTHDIEGAGRFVKWFNVTYPDIAALRASGTIEPNGFEVEPVYENPAEGDFTLIEGHPMIDAGVLIPGVNAGSFAGAAPDLGAFERGGLAPGPDPGQGDILRAGAPALLPAWPEARFRNVRLPWADPDAVLTNPALPRHLFYLLQPSSATIFLSRQAGTVVIGLQQAAAP